MSPHDTRLKKAKPLLFSKTPLKVLTKRVRVQSQRDVVTTEPGVDQCQGFLHYDPVCFVSPQSSCSSNRCVAYLMLWTACEQTGLPAGGHFLSREGAFYTPRGGYVSDGLLHARLGATGCYIHDCVKNSHKLALIGVTDDPIKRTSDPSFSLLGSHIP